MFKEKKNLGQQERCKRVQKISKKLLKNTEIIGKTSNSMFCFLFKEFLAFKNFLIS